MKPPTVRLQAYLFVASLSAMLIQVAVFVSIMLLHVPERAFESTPFRAAVLAALGCAMLVVRRQRLRVAREADSRSRSQAKLRAARAARASMRAAAQPLRARHPAPAARTGASFSRRRAVRAFPG
ncbi:hypothetical protein [Paraburkholderia lycopersici]|uniref:Uncharacterized protein n=1 Tax=Paraburkholderia lycopersici TaxID=416944 RepID=A0A1G6VB16_9BURK|nr:hypothetical protein [Paraburkholderia lycopersici]SDD50768.1 hypothetical protein SAMN05421548_120115 [Paraburkholderia lycopersici]